jgi:hypothetical protein
MTNSVLEAKVTMNAPLVRPQSIGLRHDELSVLSALTNKNNEIELLCHRSSIVEIVSRTSCVAIRGCLSVANRERRLLQVLMQVLFLFCCCQVTH